MCSSRRLGLTVAGAAGLRLPYDVSSLEGGGHKSWFRVDISPPLLAEASWPPQVDASCPCRAGQEAGAGWKLLLGETVFAVSGPDRAPLTAWGPHGSHQPASLFATEGSGVALVGGPHSGPAWPLGLVTLYP